MEIVASAFRKCREHFVAIVIGTGSEYPLSGGSDRASRCRRQVAHDFHTHKGCVCLVRDTGADPERALGCRIQPHTQRPSIRRRHSHFAHVSATTVRQSLVDRVAEAYGDDFSFVSVLDRFAYQVKASVVEGEVTGKHVGVSGIGGLDVLHGCVKLSLRQRGLVSHAGHCDFRQNLTERIDSVTRDHRQGCAVELRRENALAHLDEDVGLDGPGKGSPVDVAFALTNAVDLTHEVGVVRHCAFAELCGEKLPTSLTVRRESLLEDLARLTQT